MDKETFISVIKENQNLIFKICYTYCSNIEDRKDLQQEIMIQLWNSFAKFDGRVKISTWIYRIALNTSISFYRKDSKYKSRIAFNDVSIISFPSADWDSDQDENVALLYKFIEDFNYSSKKNRIRVGGNDWYCLISLNGKSFS